MQDHLSRIPVWLLRLGVAGDTLIAGWLAWLGLEADPGDRGLWLALAAVVLGGSLTVYAWVRHRQRWYDELDTSASSTWNPGGGSEGPSPH